MAEPNPSNVSPWYLRNINQALALDETSGNVYVRTGFQGNIIISGNVSIPGNIDAHISEIGTSGNLTVPYMPIGGNVVVTSGNVTSTLSGNLAGITGNVTVIDGGGSLTVDGNVGITGNVNIGTMPNVNALVTGNVTSTLSGNLAGITGNVNIGTMPNVNANVSGNVTATLSGNLAGITGNVTVVDGGGSLTVDGNVGISGNVNIGTMPEVEIKNDTGNPIPISKDTNVNSITNPLYVEGVNNTSFFAPWQSDAFGRLRVSNPYTLFDTQARYYDHGQFASSTTGTANVVYEANSSTYMCNVGSNSGDNVFRETVKTFPYQPGKSLLVLSTFCMNEKKSNLRQRVGFFSSSNGIFFEVNGNTVNMVIRSSSSGVLVEDRVAQINWNGDTLLGTGGSSNPSGIELNTAVDQIWFSDVEWLGVGSVRVGFVINGIYIICHTFNHANIVGNTSTYMTTATLPLRYEITNTGATGSSSMLRQICSSVISEGGFQLSGSGNPRAASHVIGAPVRLPNDQSFKPVISIRLKSAYLDAVVIPIVYTLIPVAQSIFQYRVYKKAITSGGSWVSSAADSSVEYNLAPTTLVSGDIAEESFINSSNQSSSAPTQVAFGFKYQLERQPFTGVAYEYTIMMATTGTNQDIYASIEWQEIT